MASRPSTAAFQRPSPDQVRGIRPVQFVQEIVSELRKAVWPSRDETIRLTYVVIVISAFVGLLLGVFDFTLTKTFTNYVIHR